MGEHHLPIHITDGVNSRNIGPHLSVCHNGSPFCPHTKLRKSLNIAVGPAPYTHQSFIVSSHINFSVSYKGYNAICHLCNSAGEIEGYTSFLQLLLKKQAHFAIIWT